MIKLKHCPFCGETEEGGNVHTQQIHYICDDINKYNVMCENCGCEIGEFETEEKAAEAWNCRTTDNRKYKWICYTGETYLGEKYRCFRCPECRKGTVIKSNFCPNCGIKVGGK